MKKLISAVCAALMCLTIPLTPVYADSFDDMRLNIEKSVYADGKYSNWDGVSTVSQFKNGKKYCFAYKNGSYVNVITVKNGKVSGKIIKLKLQHSIFGAVCADDEGNYYVLSGEKNSGGSKTANTVFISKYNSSGRHIATVGDNGDSSMERYYDSSFNTMIPFDCGCDIAYSNGVVMANYGREMYNGHQSNSVFSVDSSTMRPRKTCISYNSHSFAERVIPYENGFVMANEGDAYPRAIVTEYVNLRSKRYITKQTFHFYGETGDNNNYAHLGGIADLGNNRVILTGTSAKSLTSNAKSENEQLFFQIFDPTSKSTSEKAYVNKGKRSGSGKADYGVKWITNFNKDMRIYNPQVVAAGSKAVILYEYYKNGKYQGVCRVVVDRHGKVLKGSKIVSKTALLNDCEMPVYANGKIWWTANKYIGNGRTDKNLHIYSLDID